MVRGSRLMNALVGAAVTVVFSVLPFSSILGGAIAGYLEGDDLRDGGVVGALSGILAAIPFVVILITVGSFVAFWPIPGLDPGIRFVGGAVLAFILGLVAVYLVGLGAIGGIIGAYLAREIGAE